MRCVTSPTAGVVESLTMIKSLSRQANQARQAEITQEISEIVGGADALSTAG